MCALTEAHCAGMLVEAEPKGAQLKHTLTWTFFACTYGGIFLLLCLHPSICSNSLFESWIAELIPFVHTGYNTILSQSSS